MSRKTLTDIICEALVGKKLKLYHIQSTNGSKKTFYATDKQELLNTDKVIGETHGLVQSIETETETYSGDYYKVVIVDENGTPMHVNGLNSITSGFEIVE